jgi:hypothetical protein
MFGGTFTRALTVATALSLLMASVALGADGLEADADNFVGTIPGGSNSGNNHSASQAAGTTVAYQFSALIGADNQANNNVFAAAGDKVTVAITRSGDWLASGGTDFTDFTAYDVQQIGTIRITVPCGAAVGTLETMDVDLAATASNGKSLNPDEKSLNFNITSTAGSSTDCPVTPPANSAPTVDTTITGDDSVFEGDSLSYSIGATDPDGDTLTYGWSVLSGNATINGAANASSVLVDFTDGPSTVSLQVVVGDGQAGHDVTRTLSIDEANVAPTATLSNNGPKDEGSAVTASFTAPDDVAADLGSLHYEFRCDGDTSALTQSYATAGTATTTQCTYADNGSFSIAGRVIDKDGDSNIYSTAVTVRNAVPVVGVPTWQSTTINCGDSATLKDITFSDAGVNDDPWQLDIDWGDNSTDFSDPSVLTQGAYANQSHTYSTPGTYTATVSVTDKDGDTGSNTSAASGLTVNQFYVTNFLAPLDGSTPSKLVANTMKKGRVVPIKVTILDNCTGQWVNDPTANVTIDVRTATFTPSSTDAVETFSDAGASSAQSTDMRFNADSTMASGGFWIYNLDSNGLTIGTCYKVAPRVGTVLNTSNFAVLKPTK